ncbi:uncharacterized protein BDR25DRAFT_336879 [Lindgomyces ingoldianus]|uniref:Uncharacterized protein n=1 Tax=Lindgomyces ingoldianus TaxID=673940 RepID=A0ACB6QGY8_9PLEO|nr:uncharacterized protein BDR25DRAFT_336879 [Lindgomyces ingoldianus]KAF2465411.1 hypothetical protein BDR25DRAFT_336879 [Lindgomyces ingoldianus]
MTEKSHASVEQLAEQLAEGFAALSGEYQLLFDQHRLLESKLSWAKQQYLGLLNRLSPNTLSQDHLAFLQDLDRVSADASPRPDPIKQLGQIEDAGRRNRASLIRKAESASVTLRNHTRSNGVKIWSGPLADKDMSHLEKDFTTPGTPSKLGCPFSTGSGRQSPLATPRSSGSRMSLRGRRSKRPSFNDPIRAEICGNDPISASASVEGSAAVCPIRFLDQHAPEDVAKYFENHKHEIPRSHEVCIKRFQSNAESIQQLDRKYGNLVSMIQGLGMKHQPWLPKEPDDIIEEPQEQAEGEADDKVEKWATAVDASLRGCTPDQETESSDPGLNETRTAHFDRPLKEIRVGESPSRPWGIAIPAKYNNAESSSSIGSPPTASPGHPITTDHPTGETPRKADKCPFDHNAMAKPAEQTEPHDSGRPALQPEGVTPSQPPPPPAPAPPQAERMNDEPDTPRIIPQMIFNGPVFLGYPPDQLMSLLQKSNLGAAMR